jgi:tetratricopeptide (TPR) repeat protein
MGIRITLICLIGLFLFTAPAYAQTPETVVPVDQTEAARWREDLRYLAQEMPRQHRNLFHTMTREQFDAAVARLDSRIPTLARHQIIVEMERIVAMVGDGHTNISPTRDPKIGFRALPIKLYLFKDGLFIRSATRENAGLAGARVVKIGRATADEAYQAARDLVGRDNEMDAKFFAPQLLAMPEVLHSLGLSDSADAARFTIEQDGKQREVTLSPYGPAEMMPADTDFTWINRPDWVDARATSDTATTLIWLKDPADKFWFKFLPASKTLYVQFNQVGNKDTETIEAFAERLTALIRPGLVDRLVLDLRLNRGGNGALNRPLLRALIGSRLDQRGKFFTLIGRSTFSAAQFLINDLERLSNTIFIGEPSGGKANSYGDSRKITLPNSGITVRVSTLWWQEDERDHRPWTAPEIAAELTAAEYRNGIDPVLAGALNFGPRKTLTEILSEALNADPSTVVKRFSEWRADPANAYVETEEALNGLGYSLVTAKRLEQALQIFKLNVVANPESANAYDSLGEAYASAGNRELAILNYEKALALDPKSSSAAEALRKLREK